MQVIHVVEGDNELAALDYQRHYKMPNVFLMDSNLALGRKYGCVSWPSLILTDDEGQIIYKCTNLIDKEKDLLRLLEKMKKESFPAETKIVGNMPYMALTLQRSGEVEKLLQNDRFTSIASGKDGKIYVVFTSEKNGNNDVIMRIQDANAAVREIPVASTNADEYDGTVLVDDKNQVRICWTSNAIGNKYQIHLTSLKDIQENKENIVISNSQEDAMHGRMACDDLGNLWITYYRWQKIGQNSRDKEVYLRRLIDGNLSNEIHVSPEDVSEYEDHTDPSISIMNQQVYIAWSWDFHKPQGYTQDAHEPTIFARTIDQNSSLERAFHLSGPKIDSAPILSKTSNGALWCVWDSLDYGSNGKGLYVRTLSDDNKTGKEYTIVKGLVNVCSPRFAFFENQKGTLIWSQTKDGKKWSLWRAEYNFENNIWREPALVRDDGNPRFGSCVYDSEGHLWIACSVQTYKGREITVQSMD